MPLHDLRIILIDDDDIDTESIVFMLTTSVLADDVHHAYDRQVAGYLHKQQVGPDYAGLAGLLTCYARVNQFPPALPPTGPDPNDYPSAAGLSK